GGRWDEDVLRGVIAREFGRQAPQVIDARPALFEKSGRVWFIIGGGDRLLGYDGKGNWSERRVANNRFCGACPGNATSMGAGVNRQLGQYLFFVTQHGVEWLDTASGDWLSIDTGG